MGVNYRMMAPLSLSRLSPYRRPISHALANTLRLGGTEGSVAAETYLSCTREFVESSVRSLDIWFSFKVYSLSEVVQGRFIHCSSLTLSGSEEAPVL